MNFPEPTSDAARKFVCRILKMKPDEFARKPSRARREILDDLWSATVRIRDGWKCVLRGKDDIRCTSVMQGAHIVTRAAFGIRYDLRNGRCLCTGHHSYYTFNGEQWTARVQRWWKEDWDYLTLCKWTKSAKSNQTLTFIYLKLELGKLVSEKVPASKRLEAAA